MPALTPSVLLANQYEAFSALPGPPHGREGGQDRPVSGRAGHDSARQAGLGQRQTGQVKAGQVRKVLGRTGRPHEASAVGQCRTGLSRGGSRKKLQGEGHESQWCLYLYPKLKNSTDFGHFISLVPYFQFFFFKLFFKLGLWCPCLTGGAPGRPVVPLTGAPARRVVLLAGLWWP